MSFLKKLGETAKNTASSIGAKSANLVETGKLKMAKNQHEGKIEGKIKEIGQIVFAAHKEGVEPDPEKLQEKFNEIAELEAQIKEIEAQLEQLKESDEPDPAPTPAPSESPTAAEEESEEAAAPPPAQDETIPEATETTEAVATSPEEAAAPKFCANCGNPLTPGAKFCSGCGQGV